MPLWKAFHNGKSHTIANLICHLLANGKRVLVTAYTKRALEVLKNQLPEDFKSLTVNLLSSDSTSIQDLEASVNTINDELSRTNITELNKEIEELDIEYSLVKEEIAETKNEWIKLKEKSSRNQVINIHYQGTLLEIAERIEKELSSFSWFKDNFTNINNLDFIRKLEGFFSITKHFKAIDCSRYNFVIPQKEKIIKLSELNQYHGIINELKTKCNSNTFTNSIDCNDFLELKKLLESLHPLYLSIERSNLTFKEEILNDYQSSFFLWKDKLARTNKLLERLYEEKLKKLDRNVEITYPSEKTLIQLKNDAQILVTYFKERNSLSGLLFNIKKALLPKEIKEKLYFINSVRVNGSPCDTLTEFEKVIDDIKIKQDFEELETLWEIQPDRKLNLYYDRVKFYIQLKNDTGNLIGIIEESNKIKSQIESLSSLRLPNCKSNKVTEYLNACNYNILLNKSKLLEIRIEESNKYLSDQNIHPIALELIKDLIDIDCDKYEHHLSEIDSLNVEIQNYIEYKETERILRQSIPILIDDILEDTFEYSNLEQLENAIFFKHAFSEITKLLEKDYEKNLFLNLTELEQQEEKFLSKIASKKAWFNVLENLNRNFLIRQHLQAWVLAIKKIGKGTGKRALKFRKEAQLQMDKCKDSIPCWIMPIYKVAETINPELGMYDYVIIDEASQLGPDAIFLLYISKNIIIVGDDKQVSPEYVGVNADIMSPYISRHLKNIPFDNYYGTEFSFFDHATMFCRGKTVLREHFRCMPEIIEFSNKNFYSRDGKGLYPLKQYSEQRLDPLINIYCQSGYVEGQSQNIINKVEAESITNKISDLIKDERYNGKTFGVIVLQGNRQAALIELLLLKKIGDTEYHKRKIICGNSASFQGDERDIIFLSLITAQNHNRSALTKPEDERRFNVAVSRAKEQVILFHSVQLEDLINTNDLRYKLLDHFLNYKSHSIPQQIIIERAAGKQPPAPFESWFEVDVFNDIVRNNYSVIPQYEVAKGKYRIDLVALLSNGIKIAIECDGDKYHGAEQYQSDLIRQKVLERCGWQFFRIRGGEYYSNRKKALDSLWQLLRKNDTINEEEKFFTNNNHHDIKNELEKGPVNLSINKIQNSSLIAKNKNLPQVDLSKNEERTSLEFNNQNLNKKIELTISTDIFTNSDLLVFTSMSNVYKIQNRGYTTKAQIIEMLDFEPNEKIIYLTGTNIYTGYLIVAFENGRVGKILLSSYQTEFNRKKLKNAFNDESKLIFIKHIENDIDLVVLSSINKVVLFNTSQINPVERRTTKGIQVIKPKNGSRVVIVKELNQVKLNNPEYYRKSESLNVVGYYLKEGDTV